MDQEGAGKIRLVWISKISKKVGSPILVWISEISKKTEISKKSGLWDFE